MSLLEQAFEPFVKIDKRSVADGEGGYITKYEDGARILVAVTENTSSLERIAEAIRDKIEYTVVTKKNILFEHGDLIKRLLDGQVFRIYYKNNKRTPDSAMLNMRVTYAEEWSIPR